MNKFRSWIRKKENRDILGVDSVTVLNLQFEIATNPIGVGQGVFFLDTGYAFKVHYMVEYNFSPA